MRVTRAKAPRRAPAPESHAVSPGQPGRRGSGDFRLPDLDYAALQRRDMARPAGDTAALLPGLDTQGRRELDGGFRQVLRDHEKEQENNRAISKRNRYNNQVGGKDTTPAQARGTRVFRHALQPLPEGLSWPQDDYDKAPEFGTAGGIVTYLKREWKDLIAAKKIDMPTLREHYPKAADGIYTYLKPHPKTGERRTLRQELVIPTIIEVNDRALESEWVRREDVGRLTVAAWRRRAKMRQRSTLG